MESLCGCRVSWNLSPHPLQKHCGWWSTRFWIHVNKAFAPGFVTAVLTLMFYAAQVQKKLCTRSLKNLDGVTDLQYSRSEVIDSSFPWTLPCGHTNVFYFFQKVNELLQNLLSVPPFTQTFLWYSHWNITVCVYLIRMERKRAFLNKT